VVLSFFGFRGCNVWLAGVIYDIMSEVPVPVPANQKEEAEDVFA
jgi:hypothetical protein